MTDRQLAHALRREVASRRSRAPATGLSRPRIADVDTYRFRGERVSRLRVILRGAGCSRPTCTMCPLPNFGVGRRHGPSGDQLVAQLDAALETHRGCEMVSLYNDGSFFAPAELSVTARRRLLAGVRAGGARLLMVETLPQFVDEAVIRETQELLGDVHLIVAIGLQSASSRSCATALARRCG